MDLFLYKCVLGIQGADNKALSSTVLYYKSRALRSMKLEVTINHLVDIKRVRQYSRGQPRLATV